MYVSIARPVDRIDALLGPQDRLAVRKVLRRLRDEADALVVALMVGDDILDLAGERRSLPRRPPVADTSVPSTERLSLHDGTDGLVASVTARGWRGWPPMRLDLVEPGTDNLREVYELLERAGEEVEDIIIARLG